MLLCVFLFSPVMQRSRFWLRIPSSALAGVAGLPAIAWMQDGQNEMPSPSPRLGLRHATADSQGADVAIRGPLRAGGATQAPGVCTHAGCTNGSCRSGPDSLCGGRSNRAEWPPTTIVCYKPSRHLREGPRGQGCRKWTNRISEFSTLRWQKVAKYQ